MPYAPPRICKCGSLIPAGQACARCFRASEKARPSASARGYGTDWRKLRESMPKTRCVICGGHWEPGMHLDHRIPRAAGGTDDPSNLQWVHRRCHSIKTAGQDGGFGNRKVRMG